MGANPEGRPLIPEKIDLIDQAVEPADRVLELVRESQASRQTAREPVSFGPPQEIARALTAAEQEYIDAWEQEAAKSSGKTDPQIRAELAKQGLYPPQTADEVEISEQTRLAQLRTETPPPKRPNTPLPKDRPTARKYGAKSSGLRALPGYENEPPDLK